MRGCQAYMVLGNDCLFTAKPCKPALRSSLQHNTPCFPSPSLTLSFPYLVSFLTTLQAFHLFHSCCQFMPPLCLLTSQCLISNATSSRKALQILQVGFASLPPLNTPNYTLVVCWRAPWTWGSGCWALTIALTVDTCYLCTFSLDNNDSTFTSFSPESLGELQWL